MEIGIVHLTDLHIKDSTDLDNKIESLCKSIQHDFLNVNHVYLVISGDIAFSGKCQEYKKAKNVIDIIKNTLSSNRNVDVVIVPGNHDCNFDYDTQLRRNTINSVNYEILGEDNSVLDICLSVQKDFWDLWKQYKPFPENKLCYKLVNNAGDYTVTFHCFNTAWMSSIEESPGKLFFPVKKVNGDKGTADLSIAVYHHPVNWFTPETEPNNKREF